MFAALLGAGMVTVTSCADYDSDLRDLQEQIDNNMSVNDAQKLQIEKLQKDLEELDAVVKNMKNCSCGDLTTQIINIINQEADKLFGSGTGKDFKEELEDYIANSTTIINAILSHYNLELDALVESYMKANPKADRTEVEKFVKEYLRNAEGLTEAQIKDLINQYKEKGGKLDDAALSALTQTYLSQFQHFTKQDIVDIINTTVTQCACKNDLSKEDVTKIVNGIITQLQKDKKLLDEDQIKQIVNTTIENAIVIEGVNDAKKNLEEALKNYDFVTNNTYVSTAVTNLQLALEATTKNGTKINGLQELVNHIEANYVLKNEFNELKVKVDNYVERLEALEEAYDLLRLYVNSIKSCECTGDNGCNCTGGTGCDCEDNGCTCTPAEPFVLTKDAITTLLGETYLTKEQADQLYLTAHQTISSNYTNLSGEELQNTTVQALATAIQADVQELKKELDELTKRVEKNEEDIKELFKTDAYVKHLVTSIELQGAVTPTFGHAALPVGLNTNVLLAYFGQAEKKIQFPGIEDVNNDLVYGDVENWITEEDAARIGLSNMAWNGGTVLTGEKGNAGKLYLTVNPTNVDFTGTEFTLVNSLGQESLVKLEDLTPCKDKLAFGVNRGAVNGQSANGFYEALATVSADDVKSASIQILTDDLTAAVKDVYHNKQNANFSELAEAIFKAYNNKLDAYGVQAKWTDELGAHTVTSQYGIAATAVKPLSYSTLYGKDLAKLPHITPLSERNINIKDYIKLPKFDFDFSKINVDDYKINVKVHFSDIWYEADGSVWTNVHMTQYISSDGEIKTSPDKMVEEKFCIVSADGTFNGPIYDFEGGVNPGAYAGLSADQIKAINAMIALLVEDRAQVWSAQLQDAFNDMLSDRLSGLVVDVNDLIEKVSTDISGKLEDAIDDLIGGIQDKLNSGLKVGDRLINGINSITDRLNKELKNVNARLQTVALYEDAAGTYHPMSTSPTKPSVFVGNGAIALYLTSWTGEVAAPAFKKFVAVTNVYKNGKNADTDASLKAALEEANNGKFFNEVIDGDRYGVVFQPSTSVKDAVYEVVYSALDYHGKVSQRKYYVKVK